MRARLTYVPLDVAEQFDDFIIQRDEQVLGAVKARTRDYSTLSLLKLLYQVRNNSMTFSDPKKPVGANVLYSITENGTTMLDLFMKNRD